MSNQVEETLGRLASSSESKMLRRLILRTERHPSGSVAWAIRKKIRSLLPPQMKDETLVELVLKAAVVAAKDDGLWALACQARGGESNTGLS
jgi:hypothetical protein